MAINSHNDPPNQQQQPELRGSPSRSLNVAVSGRQRRPSLTVQDAIRRPSLQSGSNFLLLPNQGSGMVINQQQHDDDDNDKQRQENDDDHHHIDNDQQRQKQQQQHDHKQQPSEEGVAHRKQEEMKENLSNVPTPEQGTGGSVTNSGDVNPATNNSNEVAMLSKQSNLDEDSALAQQQQQQQQQQQTESTQPLDDESKDISAVLSTPVSESPQLENQRVSPPFNIKEAPAVVGEISSHLPPSAPGVGVPPVVSANHPQLPAVISANHPHMNTKMSTTSPQQKTSSPHPKVQQKTPSPHPNIQQKADVNSKMTVVSDTNPEANVDDGTRKEKGEPTSDKPDVIDNLVLKEQQSVAQPQQQQQQSVAQAPPTIQSGSLNVDAEDDDAGNCVVTKPSHGSPTATDSTLSLSLYQGSSLHLPDAPFQSIMHDIFQSQVRGFEDQDNLIESDCLISSDHISLGSIWGTLFCRMESL